MSSKSPGKSDVVKESHVKFTTNENNYFRAFSVGNKFVSEGRPGMLGGDRELVGLIQGRSCTRGGGHGFQLPRSLSCGCLAFLNLWFAKSMFVFTK